ENLVLQKIPLRTLRVPHVLRAQRAGAIENLREVVAQIRFVDHFLHIAQLLSPAPKIVAGDWAFFRGGGARADIAVVAPAEAVEKIAQVLEIAGLVPLALAATFTSALLLSLLSAVLRIVSS